METKDLFMGFDEAQQEQYEQEAVQKYGEERVKESRRRWDSYSQEQKAQIGTEGQAVYTDLLENIGDDPTRPEVQRIIARWHQHLRYFYEPTREILHGLGQAYAEEPAFVAFYQRIHPEMPEFLRQAITHYCRNVQ